MDAVIAKMRADWSVVAAARKGSGEWTDSDEADIAAAIRSAIEAKDRTVIACWSRWLSDLAAWVTAWNLICRGSEAAMKCAARENREKKQAEQGKGKA